MTTTRLSGKVQKPKLDHDFSKLDSLLPKSGSMVDAMHLGLPHNYFEPEEFLWAVWLKRYKNINGYPFRSAKWQPSKQLGEIVQQALTTRDSFIEYRGPKNCGGYHADFVVRYASPKGPTDLLVCLGCGEVLLFAPDGSLIIELNESTHEQLESLWESEMAKSSPSE